MYSVTETMPPYIPFFHFPGVLRLGGGMEKGVGTGLFFFSSSQVSLINKRFSTVYQLILLGFLGK